MLYVLIRNLLNSSRTRLKRLKTKFRREPKRKRSTAKEIIKRYHSGERDFRHLFIVNQSFANINLSGSSFVNTEFRGCDFNKSIFKEAKFDKAVFGFSIWQIINTSVDGVESRDEATISFVDILFSSAFLLTRITPIVIIATAVLLSVLTLAIKLAIFSFIILYFRNFLIFNREILSRSFSTDFRGADLHASSFIEATLSNCDFSHSNLDHSNFSRSLIRSVNFQDCSIKKIDFFAASIDQKCDFSIDLDLVRLCVTRNGNKVSLRNRDLSNMRLENVSFCGADLTGADLSNCNLRFGSFVSAKMEKCNLSRSDLTGSNFEGALLIDSELVASKFIDSSLENSLLPGVKALGTLFKGTNLTGACIANWQINSETRFQSINCDYVYLDYFYKSEDIIPAKRIPAELSFEKFEFENIMNQYFDLIEVAFRKAESNQFGSEGSVQNPKRTSTESEVVELKRSRPVSMDPTLLNRFQLFDAITRLPDPQFFRLQERLEVPHINRARQSADKTDRAVKFFEWADSPIGCGIEEIQLCLAYIIKNP